MSLCRVLLFLLYSMKNMKIWLYVLGFILAMTFISTTTLTYAECADECDPSLGTKAYSQCINACNSAQQTTQSQSTSASPNIEKICGKYKESQTKAQNNVNAAQEQVQTCDKDSSATCWEIDHANSTAQSAQNTLSAATQVYQQCLACAPDPKGQACKDAKKSFSCESIFAKHEDARVCNRNRCVAEKWYEAADLSNGGRPDMNNPCNCKYGFEGNGENAGIPLNTSIPFVGRCVPKSSWSTDDGSALNAFPVIIGAATKMLVTVILLVSFVMIVVGGVQWASWDAKSGKAKITKVAIGIAMLGMMGAILRLINPNFFK